MPHAGKVPLDLWDGLGLALNFGMGEGEYVDFRIGEVECSQGQVAQGSERASAVKCFLSPHTASKCNNRARKTNPQGGELVKGTTGQIVGRAVHSREPNRPLCSVAVSGEIRLVPPTQIDPNMDSTSTHDERGRGWG